jgi:hypothetical protein
MNVLFDNKEAYFEELRQAPVGTTIVRAEICGNEVHRGETQVSVLSGYFDDMFFYQADIPCGSDWSPKTEGTQAAEKLIGELKELCEQSGLALRRGRWQL